jgi:hypothetical protein
MGSSAGAARTAAGAGGLAVVDRVGLGGGGRTVVTRADVCLGRFAGWVDMIVIGSSSTLSAVCASASDSAPATVNAMAETPARSADALRLR